MGSRHHPNHAKRLAGRVLGPFAEVGLGFVFIFGPEIAGLCSALGISRMPRRPHRP